ncbi:hypothetical protein SLS63_004468 [Diaporthe eres]|uniref:Uncharacterized protein n=1 Tax=Diaporthe eres TaxID=83184 RepID=A0ABR1PEQ7_DIAER
MMVSRSLLLMAAALMARVAESASARVTSVFIDTVSGYDELSTCAEEVLSTIVRAQYSGCGDKGAVTSYTFHGKRNRISVASIDGVDNCGIGDFRPHFNLGIGIGVRKRFNEPFEGNSRPEFRWPARIAGTTQELPTQYHNHEMPAKEPIASPSSSEYHISPLPITPAPQKPPVYQVQSEKVPYQHQEFYQPPKEARHQQEPQELPASGQLSIENRHELEGSLSPLSPSGRFSYQANDK